MRLPGFGLAMNGAVRTDPQSIHTLCAEALNPFGDSLRRGVELARGSGMAQPPFNNTAHHGLSTFGRQRRILVSVHSVPLRITACLATSAFTVGSEWTTS
jgi:hypothetical protein